MMLQIITITSLLAVFYAYFGYPLILRGLNRLSRKTILDRARPQQIPKISIIITVRNEAPILKKKIEQCLSLKYFDQQHELVELIVASDASDDGSDQIAESFVHQGVRLVRLNKRGGKEVAQGEALKSSTGEIILFTDAKIELNSEALENVILYFKDLSVGIVSSVDKILHADNEGSGEGFYIKYEMWLRRQESQFGSLVGVSGSAFAVRREVCSHWRDDIPSDFSLLIRAREMGLRGVIADDFIGGYRTVKTEEEEFGRKVRTVLRGITTFFRRLEVLNFSKFGWFSWQIFSHKLCRWMVPFFIILATVCSIALIGESVLFNLLAVCIVLGYCAAALAFLIPRLRSVRILKVPLFFLVANYAILVAWIQFFLGKRSVQWSPSQKGTNN